RRWFTATMAGPRRRGTDVDESLTNELIYRRGHGRKLAAGNRS
ncbi:MAG: hypothetical protein ACI9ME_001763, partial [Ilumatobacter sp.]